VRLTVLGKSPSWSDAGGACSGYLVEEAGTVLLLDCGPGVFAKLRRFHDYARVDAVVVSHLHGDHILDLVPYAYALSLSPRSGRRGAVRQRLIAPPGARDSFRRVVGTWGSEDLLERSFALEEYGAASEVAVGSLSLSFREVPHYIQTFAVSVAGASGRIVFGADCGPNEALVELARGADVLVAEATLPAPDPTEQSRGHLTAREAGEHGRAAGVGRLVLTHWSDELGALRTREEGAAGFRRPVELAREGAVYTA
jgi:ribonuclease BN (tRNA processing enzyme)